MSSFSKIEGFFDYKGLEQSLKFEPEKIDIKKVWHPGYQDQGHNDCVPHSINMLLGCDYLKERDQHLSLAALARKNQKKKEQEKKIKIGCKLTKFKKAITDGKRIFSFNILFQWDKETTEKNLQKRRYILDEIESRGYQEAILFSNFIKKGCLEAHAYTVKKLDKGWVLLDCARVGPEYS